MPEPTSDADVLPYRVVDDENQGWVNTSNEPGGMYQADYGWKRGLSNLPLAELTARRGPWRPVLPITDEDESLMRSVFDRIGRKSITTLAAALDQVFHELRESQGGLNGPGSYEYAKRTLTAGREGSWESEVLKEVVWFGNGLNLVPEKRGQDNSVGARRKRGPSKRVDVEGRQVLAEMFTRWVSDPDRYTEVAETLASVVSGYADDKAGPDGWRAVADQWLQPGGLARDDFVACYRLLYSQSEHFDPDFL